MSFVSFKQTPQNRDTNKKLVKIVHTLLQIEDSVPFRKPVPHKALGLDDYRKIIKKPMDLNQVRRTNNQNKYKFLQEALDDIQLCWDNCMKYNHSQSVVYKQAQVLQQMFWSLLKEVFSGFYDEIQQQIRKGNKDQDQISNQPYLGNYQLPTKKKQSYQNIQENQSNMIEQCSKNKNQSINQQSHNPQKMQQQYVDSQHLNQSKQLNSQQQPNSSMPIIQRQPIQINLGQKPTKQMIQTLNTFMKQRNDDNKQILQQILQILMAYEKQNIETNKNGKISINMNNIHLTTYYRICKAIKLEIPQMLQIIE